MCPSILLAVLGMQLSTRPIAPRTAPMARACVPRCSASPEDASPNGDDAISFAALMREAQRRTGGTLGMHDRMLKEGPGGLTPSSAVVEHVLTQVAAGNVSQAFSTCVGCKSAGPAQRARARARSAAACTRGSAQGCLTARAAFGTALHGATSEVFGAWVPPAAVPCAAAPRGRPHPGALHRQPVARPRFHTSPRLAGFTCRSNNVPPGVHKSSTDWSKRMTAG
jgi:hypothetical protein